MIGLAHSVLFGNVRISKVPGHKAAPKGREGENALDGRYIIHPYKLYQHMYDEDNEKVDNYRLSHCFHHVLL